MPLHLQLMLPRDAKTNILNYMNMSSIESTAPALNWTKYMNGIFYPHIYIPDNAFIIVKNPSYLSNVSALIQATDVRTLANFIGWRVIMESTSLLGDKWARLGRKLWVNLDGRPSLRPRWAFCVSTVRKYFPVGVSSLYVRSLLDADQDIKMHSVSLVDEIVAKIVSTFVSMIQTNHWMDSKTIEEAINKTKRMRVHAGFPSQLLNDTAIDEKYELVNIRGNWSFFTNILLMRRWKMDDKYMQVQFDNVKGK